MTPPGLAWLKLFCDSTGLALDQPISTDVHPSVNPLVYTVSVRWPEPIPMKQAVQVWNIFQKWAGKNGTMPSGRVEMEEVVQPFTKEDMVKGFRTDAHLRERLGHPKIKHP